MSKGSGRTNNSRYGVPEETGWKSVNPKDKKAMDAVQQYLFGDDEKLGIPEDIGIDDMEDVYEIDTEHIGGEANTLAASNIQNLLRLYNNKEFTDEHPDFKRRIDTEVESLRKLYKMAKINEIVHDHLISSIAKHPGNASLYKALDSLQGRMLSIDGKIRDQIASFNKIITGYQMELNFAQDNDLGGNGSTAELDDGSVMSRGNKAFIEEMKNRKKNTEQEQAQTPEAIDPDNLPPGWKIDEETGEIYDDDTGEMMGNINDIKKP